VAGVVLQLLAQVANVHVDRAGVAVEVVPPHGADQLLASEHPPRVLGHVGNQRELRLGEIDRPATAVHGVALEVDLEVAHPQHGPGLTATGAAQDGAHARHELTRRERLGDVVVRPGLEALDPIVFRPLGGEQDHRQAPFGTDAPENLGPLHAGQHAVEQDDVVGLALERPERARAVGDGVGAESLQFQGIAHQLANRFLVIHHEHPRQPSAPHDRRPPRPTHTGYGRSFLAMIVVVGSMNLDRIARVRVAPGPGETVPIEDLSLAPGGKGGNVAAAAARLGAHAAMVARVGADADGERLLAALAGAGVDVRAVEAYAGAPSGTALIWVDRQGENRIGVFAGANAALSPAAVDALADAHALFAHARFVVLNLEIPVQTVRHAIDRAHQSGARVLLNFSPIGDLALDALTADDVLVVNGPEAAHLAGGPPPVDLEAAVAVATRLRGVGPGTAIVTLGARGVAAAGAEGEWRTPAVPVDPVDTTGAGDAFLGALAAALDGAIALGPALAIAAAAGAFTATRPGAQTAQPTWAQLWAFARERGLGLADLAAARARSGP
jgi:ribokinase